MPSPADIWPCGRVVFWIIVLWHVDGQSLVHIAVVFGLECKRVVFRVAGHEDVTSILRAENVNAGLVRFSEDVQIIDLLHIRAADLGVARMGSEKNVVESAQQAFGRGKDAVLVHAEQLVGEVVFWYSISMIQRGLRAPANVENGFNLC